MVQYMWEYRCLFKILISVFLDIYPESRLLDHVGICGLNEVLFLTNHISGLKAQQRLSEIFVGWGAWVRFSLKIHFNSMTSSCFLPIVSSTGFSLHLPFPLIYFSFSWYLSMNSIRNLTFSILPMAVPYHSALLIALHPLLLNETLPFLSLPVYFRSKSICLLWTLFWFSIFPVLCDVSIFLWQ